MVNAVVHLDKEKTATFGWLQVEKKAVKELQGLAMKSPASMGTLMYLINRMSRSNALVVSQQAIASELGTSRETINKAIKYLSQHNFIQVIKAGGSSVYVVNSRVAWQGERGARYAHFGADVIAIESEQLADLDNLPPLKGVPKLQDGERILVGNEQIEPPDQQEMELP
jgi:DNA-binding transcriptional MocR family regulator